MQATLSQNQKRIESIDLLRGIIMVIMALDHTRDFFYKDALTGNPLNPATTTPVLYFTRWITHFCAPNFVFLSGLSAWLQSGRKTKKELAKFLISRGAWLIIADLTLMSFALTADIHFGFFLLETLWSIGISMIVLGLLIRLPIKIIFALGLIIFFGHNLMDFGETALGGNVPVWWSFLHSRALVPLWGNHNLFILYPFLPWTGLMLLGYCCGKLFTDTELQRRKKILLRAGISAILFFVIVRFANIYGDPVPWSHQESGLKTFFSFMNVQKYPPSLLFLCSTVGPALIFLALVKNTESKLSAIISVYGRVPFFYFVVHLYFLHLAQIITYLARGHSLAEGMQGSTGAIVKFTMPGEGYSLPVVYAIWLATVILMYPLCKQYDNYKRNHKEKRWLSYL
ncbi:MAG: heparan-alpha-glucosaminide N-acetyltransferase domain-containing protein [Bacteroidota bacterium]